MGCPRMYFDLASGFEPSPSTRSVANPLFEIYWEGLLFAPGIPAGQESAQALLDSFELTDDLSALVKKVHPYRGNWSLCIHAVSDGSWIACADHSHQSHLFHSHRAFSSSFLRMREERIDRATLAEETMAGFLLTGFCNGPRAFYEDLAILDYRFYLSVQNGELAVRDKRLPSAFEPSGENGSFVGTLGRLFESLRNENISLDLTGGTDSRILAISLDHLGHEFEVATEGDEIYSEVEIARMVAQALGKELKRRNLSSHHLGPDDLREAWRGCDGLDLHLLSHKFETWRREFGYSLAISGFAGELYKDGGWHRAALASRLSRTGTPGLINRIIDSGNLMTWDGASYAEILAMLTPKWRDLVRQWLEATRSRLLVEYRDYSVWLAADRIFFEFNINRPAGTRIPDMPRYTPLTEPDLVRIGVNQPALQRLNHRLYRKEIGRLHSPAARVPTDRGELTLSHHRRHQPGEWFKYSRHFLAGRSIGKARGQKTENKNQSVADAHMLSSGDLREALGNLRELGIASPEPLRPTMPQAKRLLILHFVMSN